MGQRRGIISAREVRKQATTRRRGLGIGHPDIAGFARTHRLHLSGRGRGNAAARVRDAAIGTKSATAERLGAGSGEVKGGARERHRFLTARSRNHSNSFADTGQGKPGARDVDVRSNRVLQSKPVSIPKPSTCNSKELRYNPDRASPNIVACFVKRNAPLRVSCERLVTLAGTPGDDSSVGGVDRPSSRPRRCVAATGTRTAWRAVTPSARGEWAGASRQSARPLRAGAPGATPSRSPRRAPRARARGCAKVRGASRPPPSTLSVRTRGTGPRSVSRFAARTARSIRDRTRANVGFLPDELANVARVFRFPGRIESIEHVLFALGRD